MAGKEPSLARTPSAVARIPQLRAWAARAPCPLERGNGRLGLAYRPRIIPISAKMPKKTEGMIPNTAFIMSFNQFMASFP